MSKNQDNVYESLLHELQQGKYRSVYFLHGDEPYFVDVLADYFEKKSIPEADRSFNQTILYGRDTDLGSVISLSKRFPMMAARQLVMVKEAQDLKDLDKKIKTKVGDKEVAFNPLEEYLKSPVPSTILVFCHKDKLDGKKSISKVLTNAGALFELKSIPEYQLADWISSYCRSRKIQIQESACVLLSQHIGNNISRIANELDKILINLSSGETISEAHISKYVGISKEYNVFEWQNAIGRKDLAKALTISQYFASNPKEHPFQRNIVQLFGYFSKLLILKSYPKASEDELSRVLQVRNFQVRDYVRAGQHYSDRKLVQIIGFIRDADMASKGYNTSALDDGEIMKELLVKIMI